MKNPTKLYFLIALIVLMGNNSCKKEGDSKPPVNLEISGQLTGRDYLINWTRYYSSDFKNYIIVRSKQSLPSSYEPSLPSDLIVFESSDPNIDEFRDMSLPLGEQIFYTLFVDTDNGYLRSEEVELVLDYTFLDFFVSFPMIDYNTDLNLLYIINKEPSNESKLMVFDLETNEITATYLYDFVFTNRIFAHSIKEGINEIYLGKISGNGGMHYEILDARTLEKGGDVDFTDDYGTIQFLTNRLGHLCFKGAGAWKVLNPVDGSMFAWHNSVMDSDHLFNIGNNDLKFIAVGDQRMDYVSFNENGFINGLSGKSLEKEPALYHAVAPDGESFLAHQDGSVFNKNLEKIGQIGTEESEFDGFAYTVDGSGVFAFDASSSVIKKYNTTNFREEESLEFNFQIRNVFINGNEMIVVGARGVPAELVIQSFDYTL